MRPVQIGWIEPLPQDCWQFTRDWLTRTTACAHLSSVEECLSGGNGNPHALPQSLDLVLLVAAYPDMFHSDSVASLRRKYPLAGIVQLLGPWSDGARRTGRALLGTRSIHWRESTAWLQRQTHAWNAGSAPQWYGAFVDLAEGLEKDNTWLESMQTACVGIVTAHRWISESYVDILEPYTRSLHDGIDELSGTSPDLSMILWDDAPWVGQSPAELSAVVTRITPIPVLAIVTALRPHELERYRRAGAADVLSKPFSRLDLLWKLHNLVCTRARPHEQESSP